MLVASIFDSLLLLAATNLIAHRLKSSEPAIACLCFLALFGHPFLGLLVPKLGYFFPPVIWLSIFLLASLIVSRMSGRGPSIFHALSAGAFVLSYGICGVAAYRDGLQYQRLRAAYPYISLDGRLKPSTLSPRSSPIGPDASARLSRIEENLGSGYRRGLRLKRLHEEKVELFMRSFGFGIERMGPSYPSGANLRLYCGDAPIPLQPGPRVAFSKSPGEWLLVEAGAESPLSRLLDQSITNFADPEAFGYIKDRHHVAGFEPHRFSEVPDSKEAWKVQTLDLIGLLLEPEPRVYVSDKLPNMEDVRAVPTRPLDKFETVGLLTLRDGEDLWIAQEGTTARMIGAIRSTQQCIACHEGSRGDLLGAFSYTLRQEGANEIDPSHQ